MSEERRARWSQYEELPDGERMQDRFTGFWRPGEAFEMETIDISVLHVHPGESGPKHAHDDPVEEIYVVEEGQLRVEVGDETVDATEGMVFYFPPGVQHRPFNDGDEPAKMLSIRSKADGETNFSGE